MASLVSARYLSVPWRANDAMTMWNKVYWSNVISDRFGFLNRFSPYHLSADKTIPVPALKYEYSEIGEICDMVAQRCLEFAGNRPIVCSWSGGVDSTAVIVAFLKAGAKDKLRVIHTPTSIQENLVFYNLLVKEGVHLEMYEPKDLYATHLKYEGCVFTSGWSADQLYGSNVNNTFPELFDLGWKEGLQQWREKTNRDIDQRLWDSNIAIYEQYFDVLPFDLDIQKFSEFAWLGNFCLKFSHVTNDLAMTFTKNSMRSDVFPFFAQPEFQDWSIMHYKENCQIHPSKNIYHYKTTLKDYIIAYTKDESYRWKSKQNSWLQHTQTRENLNRLCIKDTEGFKSWKVESEQYGHCSSCLENIPEMQELIAPYKKLDRSCWQ